MSLDDRTLIDRMKRGDASAFDALYAAHRDWAMALAWRFTRDYELALDVVQETFLYLVRVAPELELRTNLRTFLYPVLRNLSATLQQRARKSAGKALHVSHEDPAGHATDPTSTPVDVDALQDAINQLPDHQRDVLRLRFNQRLSLNEIAEALDIPLGTVKSRLYEALASLRADDRTRGLWGDQ